MHTLSWQRAHAISGWRMIAFASLIALFVLGLGLSVARPHQAPSVAAAPAYVSETSSMIGTADGSLTEGPTVAASAPAAPAGFDGGLIAGLSALGLSALGLTILLAYTRVTRRLT